MYTVIIPTKNESENIARCIRSIKSSVQNGATVEIIVVDNGSTDNTVDIARMEGALVLSDTSANISGLRNLGALNASYEIIGFIDADCEACTSWIENAKEILHDDSIGIVGDYPLIPPNPNWIEKALFENIPRKRREVSYLGSCNMITRKEVFFKVGGFDNKTITGEDYVLCLKMKSAGLKVLSDPTVSVIHYGNSKSLMALFNKEVWRGLGMIDLVKHGKITLPLIWSILNIMIIMMIIICLGMLYFRKALVLIISLLLLPSSAVLFKSLRNESYNRFSASYIIYMVYGFARTVSLLKLVSIQLRQFSKSILD